MRIALVSHFVTDRLCLADFYYRALLEDGTCEVKRFLTGYEYEGFDEYWYVDDGPTRYMEPKYRPARYFALDMVVPTVWFVNPPDVYVKRMKNFDRAYVFTGAAKMYCEDNGLSVELTPFGADADHHRPYDVSREFDWVAIWHNCGDRIEASKAATRSFPTGRVAYGSYEEYAKLISRGKCALNMSRADIVNMRVYEVMAVGTPLITNRMSDLPTFGIVEEEHYLGYDDIDEMLSAIGWVVEHPADAQAMAQRARDFILNNHTYVHRVRELLA